MLLLNELATSARHTHAHLVLCCEYHPYVNALVGICLALRFSWWVVDTSKAPPYPHRERHT